MKRRKNVYFITGGILSAVLTLIIIVGLFWTPYSTTGMNAKEKMQPPSLTHILGTDNFGRDVFSRVMEGAGTSFMIAVLVVLIGCVPPGYDFPAVINNNAAMMREVVRYLTSLGHEKIAFIGGVEEDQDPLPACEQKDEIPGADGHPAQAV